MARIDFLKLLLAYSWFTLVNSIGSVQEPIFDDAPADIVGATLLTGGDRALHEFSRNESFPDIDVFRTLANVGREFFVIVLPSFSVFEEIYDTGTVTIEILDAGGNLTPSVVQTPIDPFGLAQVGFVVPTTEFFIRVSPESGLHFGEYALFTGQRDFDSPEQAFRSYLNERYTDIALPSRIETVLQHRVFRFGFHGVENIKTTFTIQEDSGLPVIGLVVISELGRVMSIANLTADQGTSVFEFTPATSSGFVIALKLRTGTRLTLISQLEEPNLVTLSCVETRKCPPGSTQLGGFLPNSLIAVDVSGKGDYFFSDARVAFFEKNATQEIGSYGFGFCSALRLGSFLTESNDRGEVDLSWTHSTSIGNCDSLSLIQLRRRTIASFLGNEGSASAIEASCRGNTCLDNTLSFVGEVPPAADLRLAVQGISGGRLVIEIRGVTVYDASIALVCREQPKVVKVAGILTLGQNVNVSYSVSGGTTCAGQQVFVVGQISKTIPEEENNDLAIYIGVGVSCSIVVAAGVYFAFQRPPWKQAKAVVVKE